MKIRFINIDVGEKLLYMGKEIKAGEVVDLPKERAIYYIGRNKAEKVKTEKIKTEAKLNE